MSATPCGEHPTTKDNKNIRRSIYQRRSEREAFYQQREEFTIRREGDVVYAGEYSYKVVEDPQSVRESIREQAAGTRQKREETRDAREALSDERRSQMRSEEAKGRALQGDIGEQEAARIASNFLGLQPVDGFSPAKHGIDHLYQDQDGNLVMIEAKCSVDAFGKGDLRPTDYGREGSVEWLKHVANKMRDPASGLSKGNNKALGQEILDRLESNPDSIKRVLAHAHAESLGVTISEDRANEDWQPFVHLQPQLEE